MSVQAISKVVVDPRDVAAIEALEPKVRELVEAAKAAFPALLRLVKADYPGAGGLLDHLGGNQAATELSGGGDGELVSIAEALDELRVGGGDRAALDYYVMCVKDGESIPEAVAELFDRYDSEEAIESADALRRYAATVEGKDGERRELAALKRMLLPGLPGPDLAER